MHPALATSLAWLVAVPRPGTPTTPVVTTPDEIAIVLEEQSKSGKSRTELVLPIDGSMSVWVREGTDPRFCRASAEARRDGRVEIELTCARHEGNVVADLRLHVERKLSGKKPVLLGEVERADGKKMRIHAEPR